MSAVFQVVEKCDRCGADQVVEYQTQRALEKHQTTMVSFHVDTKPSDGDHTPEINSAHLCAACAQGAIEWFTSAKAAQ